MPKLAANLTMLFTEHDFGERFGAAARAGFKAVECVAPYALSPAELRDTLDRHGLQMALFNFPAGDWAAGERGFAADPARVEEMSRVIDTGIAYARASGCKLLHLMAGKTPPGADPASCRETLIANVRLAADAFAAEDGTVVLEAINTRIDIPGYFYDRTDAVLDVIRAADRPNVKLLYDIYHMQIMEGDLARTIERHLPAIGHVQLADNPGRGEPGSGEINCAWLLPWLDTLGYDGWVGCEYKPRAGTLAGIGWATPYL